MFKRRPRGLREKEKKDEREDMRSEEGGRLILNLLGSFG